MSRELTEYTLSELTRWKRGLILESRLGLKGYRDAPMTHEVRNALMLPRNYPTYSLIALVNAAINATAIRF